MISRMKENLNHILFALALVVAVAPAAFVALGPVRGAEAQFGGGDCLVDDPALEGCCQCHNPNDQVHSEQEPLDCHSGAFIGTFSCSVHQEFCPQQFHCQAG